VHRHHMPDVPIRTAALAAQTARILRLGDATVGSSGSLRRLVDGLAVGVVHAIEKPVRKTAADSYSSAVVDGVGVKAVIVDGAHRGIRPGKVRGELSFPDGLVVVVLAAQVRALGAYVCNLDRRAPTDLPLHRHVPVLRIRRRSIEVETVYRGDGPDQVRAH